MPLVLCLNIYVDYEYFRLTYVKLVISVKMYTCACDHVSYIYIQRERDRERQRDRDRETDRETETERDRDRERDRETETERERQRERFHMIYHNTGPAKSGEGVREVMTLDFLQSFFV